MTIILTLILSVPLWLIAAELRDINKYKNK